MELTHFSADTDPVVVADHLRRWGYAIVDDVVDAHTMDRLVRSAPEEAYEQSFIDKLREEGHWRAF